MYRNGIGYDVHPLVKGRPLVLGGVEIPYEFGLGGHSDADVLIHAIMDAMLGALALGDLGRHFPEENREFHNASSLELLARVVVLVQERRYRLVNADSVIIAQQPRMQSYLPLMREQLASVLDTVQDNVSVKATTHEALGALGRGEGIAAYGVVLLESTEKEIR